MIFANLWQLLRPRDPERFYFRAGSVRGSIHPAEFAAALARTGTSPNELESLIDRFSLAMREAHAQRGRLDVLQREVPTVKATADRLIPIARAVFGLPELEPLTGRGVVGTEAIGVLLEWSTWVALRRVEEFDRRDRTAGRLSPSSGERSR